MMSLQYSPSRSFPNEPFSSRAIKLRKGHGRYVTASLPRHVTEFAPASKILPASPAHLSLSSPRTSNLSSSIQVSFDDRYTPVAMAPSSGTVDLCTRDYGSPPASVFQLLELPTEIRMVIYEYLLEWPVAFCLHLNHGYSYFDPERCDPSLNMRVNSRRWTSGEKQTSLQPYNELRSILDLFLLNKTIYREMYQLVYPKIELTLRTRRALSDFNLHLPSVAINIQHASIFLASELESDTAGLVEWTLGRLPNLKVLHLM